MRKAGVIGLGVAGGGIAVSLAAKGMLGAVYDIRPNASDTLEGVPPVSSSPAEVARQNDIIFIVVLDAAQAKDCLTGPKGVLSQARPDLHVVLMCTISIDDLNDIRTLSDAAGIVLVDCGVTGGGEAAAKNYTCLVGGTDEAVAHVRPSLEAFSRLVVHMGGPNAGMAAKIARNVIVYGCMRAGYEGARLAVAAGVELEKLTEVVESSAQAIGTPLNILKRGDPLTNVEEMAFREYVRGLLVKDLGAAFSLAKSLGVSLPLAELAVKTDRELLGMNGL